MGWRGQHNRDEVEAREWRERPLRERYDWVSITIFVMHTHWWRIRAAKSASSILRLPSSKFLQRHRQARDFRIVWRQLGERTRDWRCALRVLRLQRVLKLQLQQLQIEGKTTQGLVEGGARVLRSIKRIQRDDIYIGEARFLRRQSRRAAKLGYRFVVAFLANETQSKGVMRGGCAGRERNCLAQHFLRVGLLSLHAIEIGQD